MEELIMKMHEEAMDLQQAVTTMRGILDELRDMICAEECRVAENSYNDKSDVERATLRCKDVRRALGDAAGICEEAQHILKEREDAERNRSSKDDKGSSAE